MNRFAFILLASVLLAACDQGVDSPRGFSLPPGQLEAGKQVFMDLNCMDCHSLAGTEQVRAEDGKALNIVLGGKTARIRSYAELLTSVINPSHRIAPRHKMLGTDAQGESKMRNYNEVMTVDQLINLVTFLEAQYTLEPYYHSRYPMYQ